MLEFALALPVFLLLIFGVIEFGRLLMTFSAVFSAAREAARYGAAVGDNGSGTSYAHDCAGMQAAAVRVGFLGGVDSSDVSISLRKADGTVYNDWCSRPGDPTDLGDQIQVSVTSNFWSILPLVNLPNLPVSSSSSRTIVQNVEVNPGDSGGANQFTLTINKVGSGTVTPASGSYYNEGTSVPLTATPDPCWVFTGWTGDLNSTANPASILMNSNKTITANFTPATYTLNLTTVGSGTVTKTLDRTYYDCNENVQLSASASPGWELASWSGDLSGNANPATITMNSNKNVTATFTNSVLYTLTINTNGSGTVTKNPDQPQYHYGDVVQLTATPATDWAFTTWAGGLTGSTNPATITITGDTTITANFQWIEYTLTVNIVGNGSVTKNPSKAVYHNGDIVTLTATPDTGWLFTGWTGNLTGNANPATITITTNTTITANFRDGYVLTVTTSGNGTVAVSPLQEKYNPGTSVRLTATPAAGWSFSGWSGSASSSDNPLDIVMDYDKIVVATFTQNLYSLTINIVGHGSVTKSPDKTSYLYGDLVALTATPDTGWPFAGWSGDFSGVNSPATVTITKNMVITATFPCVAAANLVKNPTMTCAGDTCTANLWNKNTGIRTYIKSMIISFNTNNANKGLAQIYFKGGLIYDTELGRLPIINSVTNWKPSADLLLPGDSANYPLQFNFENNSSPSNISVTVVYSNECP